MHSPNLNDSFSLSTSSCYSSAQSNTPEEEEKFTESSRASSEAADFVCDEEPLLIYFQMLSDIKYKPGKKDAKRNAKLQAIERGI